MLFGKDLSFFARVSSGVRALLRPNTYPGPARHPKLIAHRGDARTAPENTRASCEAALEAGADGVELDVCVTRDGVAVLWHDIDPNARLAVYRQSGADNGRFVPRAPPPASTLRRPIHELTFSEVREHYGYIAAEGLLDRLRAAGEHKQIERLDEVVPWLSHTPLEPLFLDVKLRAADIESVGLVADELARLARTHPACFTRAVHVATPEREIFGALRSAFGRRPELAALRLTADFEQPGVVQTAQEVGARHIAIGMTLRRSWAAVRDEIADAIAARQSGVLDSVTVWTVEDASRLSELARLGVDAVLTDDLAGARRALKGRAAEDHAPRRSRARRLHARR